MPGPPEKLERRQIAIGIQIGTCAPEGKYTLLQNGNAILIEHQWLWRYPHFPWTLLYGKMWVVFPRSSCSLNAAPIALGIGIKPAAQPGWPQIRSSGYLEKDVPQSQIFCERPFTKERFSLLGLIAPFFFITPRVFHSFMHQLLSNRKEVRKPSPKNKILKIIRNTVAKPKEKSDISCCNFSHNWRTTSFQKFSFFYL